MAVLARWCYRHRLVVLLLWVGALFGLGFAATTAGTDYANVFSLPNTDSKRAYDQMEKAFPNSAGDTDTVVWKVDAGTVRDASVRSRIQPVLDEIAAMKGVGQVAGPYQGERGAAQISRNGRIAYAQITFAEQANAVPKDLVQKVVDTAQGAERSGLQVELGGQAIQRVQEPPTGLAEMVGILAAAVVLFLAFGSLFAMLLPIGIAIFGVGTGLFSTQLLSHSTAIPDLAPLLATLIGLGVGIDYALFIVTRHRRGILRGLAPEESAVVALNTSGRAVLFAGGTVCIALAGMLVTNLRFLDGVVIGTSLTVVFSVLAATTLLAGAPRSSRHPGAQPPPAAQTGPTGARTRARERGRGTLVDERAAPPPDDRRARAGRDGDPRDPGPVAAPRRHRPGQRRRHDDDQEGLRPARRGLRPRLQRPPAGGRDRR